MSARICHSGSAPPRRIEVVRGRGRRRGPRLLHNAISDSMLRDLVRAEGGRFFALGGEFGLVRALWRGQLSEKGSGSGTAELESVPRGVAFPTGSFTDDATST